MKILVIEDDKETSAYIVQGLREEGHNATSVIDGQDGLFTAVGEHWDLLIVDRMLPGVDGLTLVRTLRSGGSTVPILFLTTMAGVGDRVSGLNAGADDYLVKPFAFVELVARVAALGRRPATLAAETVLRVADLEMDLLARTVRRANRAVDLQPREFSLLEYMMRHAGQVVTRTMLLENVWDFHFDPHTNIVESQMSRLRTKLNQDGGIELIHTVRGAGYCLRAPS